MKRQISTPFYLIFLISLLAVSSIQAQQNRKSNTVTKKQKTGIRFELAKTNLQKIIDGAEKKPANNKYADFKFSTAKFTHPVLTNSSRLAKPLNLKSGEIMQDSLAKKWIKKTVFASKRRNSVGRTSISTARKSAAMAAPSTLFVNYKATGLGDGSSWENAFEELADALLYAKNNPGVSQIWVANGVYHPLFDHDYKDGGEAYNPRDNVFMLLPGIKIYGGFGGYETSVSERNLRISSGVDFAGSGGDFATILSGDILNDDYSFGTEDNTYHVVFSAGPVEGASLDGFVIAGGTADGEESVTVNEQTISRTVGGGIAVFNSAPVLSNLLIADNYALLGSGIYTSESNFVMTNALIIYNYSSRYGPIYVDNSSPVITNATITSNSAAAESGGIVFNGTNTAAAIRNTIVYGNGPDHRSIFFSDHAQASFAYSIVEGSGGSGGWNIDFGTDQDGNLDTDPLFNSVFYGYFGLNPNSPAINAGNNLYFEAGQTPDLTDLTTDQRGTSRIEKGTVDIGALESLYGILTSNLMPNNQGILFVKKEGAGSMTGDSWENAAPEVADALLAASIKFEILEIWVAGGTYLPLYRPDDLANDDPKDPYNTFLMVDGVSVYGGFAGTETSLDQRDLSLSKNTSILSGDFDGNDDFNLNDIQTNGINEESENAYHVVNAVGLRQYGAALNGFTIEGGQNLSADFEETMLINETEVPTAFGSGILVLDADPLIENVIIRNNIGILGGGFTGFNSGAVITNALIYHNIDLVAGSGIVHFSSYNPMIVLNTTVAQNLSLTNGPAVGIIGADILITNSIFYNNILSDASSNGGGVASPSDFSAMGAGGLVAKSIIGGSGGSISWKLQNPDSETNLQDFGGNLDEDPAFVDISSSDFSLTKCSPAINAGDTFFYQEGTIPEYDLVGKPRIVNEILDMGPLEFQDTPGETALAENGQESSFVFEDTNPHTFSVEGAACGSDLLTLAPEVLSGSVTAKVWVDAQVNSFSGAFYLQRHFDISPADNAEASTGKVILYFTQAEFDALNSKLNVSAYVPTGDPDGEENRKGNFRIYQFHGPSEGGTGSPSSYGDSRAVIDPDDDDINWNAGQNRWEVAFYVNGFSGFFGGTISQNPLPVRLVNFEAKRTSEQETKLDWKVVEQENIETYNVEYSANGKKFSEIGQVFANTLAQTDYSFTDAIDRSGEQAYYRLKIIEPDGKTAYSRIISVKLSAAEGMIAYPVPANNDLWIDWKKTDAHAVEFVDLTGRVLKTVRKSSAFQKVDISGLPVGVFILKGEGMENFKVVKD